MSSDTCCGALVSWLCGARPALLQQGFVPSREEWVSPWAGFDLNKAELELNVGARTCFANLMLWMN